MKRDILQFRMHLTRISFYAGCLLFISLFFNMPAGDANEAFQELMKHPKLKITEKLKKKLNQDIPVQVIVELREKKVAKSAEKSLKELIRSGIKDKKIQKKVSDRVMSLQDQVIRATGVGTRFKLKRFKLIRGFATKVKRQELEVLLKNEDVLSITEDVILKPNLKQGIPLIHAQNHRNQYNGEGIAIAICDTGIDYNHPMLGDGSFPNDKVIGGYDIGEDDNDPIDESGHGTCCAGIAAGNLGDSGDYIGGVAYNAKLYALKVSHIDQTTNEEIIWTSDVLEAWEYCIIHQNDNPANPILIISTSLGGGRYFDNCDGFSPLMKDAADLANLAGITLFVAAGNDGYCDSINLPACLSKAISVGAVYDASFGNYSPCVSSESCADKFSTTGCLTGYYSVDATAVDKVTSYSNSANMVDLLAPSNKAYTTDIKGKGGYNKIGDYKVGFGGTSAACPYAAGAAACLQSAAKSIHKNWLTPDEVRYYLTNYGDPILDEKDGITKPRINLGNSINAIPITPPAPSNMKIIN